MSKSVLRVRIISLHDAGDHPFTNVLLYLKKLSPISTSSEPLLKLHEIDPESATVLSFNETFDVFSNNEYYQILFIDSKTKSNIITDFIFWSKHLFDLINESKTNKNAQSELPCNAPLEQNYILKFSLRLVEDSIKEKNNNRERVRPQPFRGHLMSIKQFNEPVHCAICKKFIWGLRYQGCQCSQCSLVTHRKCHKRISFWCQRSSNPGPCVESGNRRFQFHLPHVFKRYGSPLVRSIFYGAHCNHCGSQVSRNALKCTICNFIVHEQCEINLPPMCGISYKAVANALDGGLFKITEIDSNLNSTEEGNDSDSDSSSITLPILEPLPKENLNLLPKFSDFQCIGCFGSGRYANVYCVQHIPSKEYVAIKVIDGTIEEARHQFEVERQILFRYSEENPYIIKPYCSFHHGSNLFLVMDFVDGDTLSQKIQKTRMNDDEIKFYLAEIISVIQYLHSKNIVYRDLKLEHVIVSSDGHIRLVDYGLGRLLKTPDEMCYTVCGTNGYMAPEVHRLEDCSSEDGYSYPVDFWALGIILLQMLCRDQFDFHPENNDEINYLSNFVEKLELPSSEARSCLSGLLEIDPKKRLGSVNSPYGPIRDHPFFNVGKRIDWQEIDGGVFKSIHKRRTLMRSISDASVDLPLPTLLLERGARAKAGWMTAGESKCSRNDEEQFKLFDYINQSTWRQFNRSN